MKKTKRLLSILLVLSLMALMLTACKNKAPSEDTSNTTLPTDQDQSSDSKIEAEDGKNGEMLGTDETEHIATLVADMSLGNAEGETDGLISRYEYGYDGELTISILAQGLSELTGLDFAINEWDAYQSASVVWSSQATFIVGLGEIQQKDEFYVYDNESLAWFMMDSMYRTIIENYGGEGLEVYYMMDGNQPLRLNLSYPSEFSTEEPYMGSPFYFAHADGFGDEDGFYEEQTADWDGPDFAPNLSYGVEYEIMGDSGEYLEAPEAAKITFDTMRINGNIPEYSDAIEYTMVLVDITDIQGEECYVYRLDVDESTGTIGAACAYAYQSGNIYIQGYAGEWVTSASTGLGDTMLIMDTSGFEGLGGDEYIMDNMLFISLRALNSSSEGAYDESGVVKRIEALAGADIRMTTALQSEEHTLRLSYPAWIITYERGENEDTAYCADLFFCSDTAEYWAHTQVPADWAEDYQDIIVKTLNTVEVFDVN